MANAQRGNKILIDTAGLVANSTRSKVVYALFTPAAAGDSVVLRESASSADIFVIAGAVAHDTKQFRFDQCPLVFGDGIYVQSITSGAKLLLVTTTGGSN